MAATATTATGSEEVATTSAAVTTEAGTLAVAETRAGATLAGTVIATRTRMADAAAATSIVKAEAAEEEVASADLVLEPTPAQVAGQEGTARIPPLRLDMATVRTRRTATDDSKVDTALVLAVARVLPVAMDSREDRGDTSKAGREVMAKEARADISREAAVDTGREGAAGTAAGGRGSLEGTMHSSVQTGLAQREISCSARS